MKREKGEPYIVSFMGINGTGKTTTIAKFANFLRVHKFSAVIAAADTYRAGAIEQISEHANRLNIKIIAQNYGSDPAAVARDAVLYATSHRVDCVLIDTAGRMQTSKNLMDQISKINKVVNPDLKLFVGDALAGNDTVSQAREFYNHTKFDGAILTKSDADARGGAAISIVKVTSSPILYLGVGQEYKDLEPFDKNSFLESLFGAEEISIPQTQPEIKDQQQQEISMQEKTEQVKPKIRVELKQELKPEPKQEVKPVPAEKVEQPKPVAKQEKIQVENEEDPFAGIATKDIEKFSDLFDVPPPENDKEARELATRLRKWILQGRPKTEENAKEESIEEETMKQEDVKPKKKHSLFGWGRK